MRGPRILDGCTGMDSSRSVASMNVAGSQSFSELGKGLASIVDSLISSKAP